MRNGTLTSCCLQGMLPIGIQTDAGNGLYFMYGMAAYAYSSLTKLQTFITVTLGRSCAAACMLEGCHAHPRAMGDDVLIEAFTHQHFLWVSPCSMVMLLSKTKRTRKGKNPEDRHEAAAAAAAAAAAEHMILCKQGRCQDNNVNARPIQAGGDTPAQCSCKLPRIRSTLA